MTKDKSVHQLKIEAQKKKIEILVGKEKNLKAYSNLRREIAKILTLARQNEIIAKLKKEEGKK